MLQFGLISISGGARGIHLSSSEYPKNQMTNIMWVAFCVAGVPPGPGDPVSARQRGTTFPIPFVSVHLASLPPLLSLSLFPLRSSSSAMRLCVYAIQLCCGSFAAWSMPGARTFPSRALASTMATPLEQGLMRHLF
jgi:hypothetical protein